MSYDKLFMLGKPCFYLGTMDTSDIDALSRNIPAYHKRCVVRVVRGNKSRTVGEFFNEISAALQFPLYFGENWNAFRDCITDLDWIDGSAYLLLISNAPLLLSQADDEDFRVLIRILSEANEDWIKPNRYIPRNRQATPFHVVFQLLSSDLSTFPERLIQAGGEFDTL